MKNSILSLLGLAILALLSFSTVAGATQAGDPAPAPDPVLAETIAGTYIIEKPDGTPPIPGSVATMTIIPNPALPMTYFAVVDIDGTLLPAEGGLIFGVGSEYVWRNRRGTTGTLSGSPGEDLESQVDGDNGDKDRILRRQ